MTTLLQALVRLYKNIFSASLNSSCRFTPTCSDYALDALERHGAVIGSGLTLWRILRCNPFVPGGLDLVPTKLHHEHIRTHTCHIGNGKNPGSLGEREVSAASREHSARAQSLATEPWN